MAVAAAGGGILCFNRSRRLGLLTNAGEGSVLFILEVLIR
jgi:hypothetical protein